MDAKMYVTLRQQELRAEAERNRVARLADLARECRGQDAPGTIRLLANAMLGRPPRPVMC